MLTTPPFHLSHQILMPQIECIEFALPSECLRMAGGSFFMFGEDSPKSMEFTVLSLEMLP